MVEAKKAESRSRLHRRKHRKRGFWTYQTRKPGTEPRCVLNYFKAYKNWLRCRREAGFKVTDIDLDLREFFKTVRYRKVGGTPTRSGAHSKNKSHNEYQPKWRRKKQIRIASEETMENKIAYVNFFLLTLRSLLIQRGRKKNAQMIIWRVLQKLRNNNRGEYSRVIEYLFVVIQKLRCYIYIKRQHIGRRLHLIPMSESEVLKQIKFGVRVFVQTATKDSHKSNNTLFDRLMQEFQKIHEGTSDALKIKKNAYTTAILNMNSVRFLKFVDK